MIVTKVVEKVIKKEVENIKKSEILKEVWLKTQKGFDKRL